MKDLTTPGFGPSHQPQLNTPMGPSPTGPRIRDKPSPEHHACSAKRQTAWNKTTTSNSIQLDIHRWASTSFLQGNTLLQPIGTRPIQ